MCLSVHKSKSRISWRFHTHKCPASKNTMHLSHSGWLHSFSIILPGRMSRSALKHSMPALSWRINCPLCPHATIKTSQTPHALFFLLCVYVTSYEKTIHSVLLSSHTHVHNTDSINSSTWPDWLKIHNLLFSQRHALSLTDTSPKHSPLHFFVFYCTWYTADPQLKAPNTHFTLSPINDCLICPRSSSFFFTQNSLDVFLSSKIFG